MATPQGDANFTTRHSKHFTCYIFVLWQKDEACLCIERKNGYGLEFIFIALFATFYYSTWIPPFVDGNIPVTNWKFSLIIPLFTSFVKFVKWIIINYFSTTRTVPIYLTAVCTKVGYRKSCSCSATFVVRPLFVTLLCNMVFYHTCRGECHTTLLCSRNYLFLHIS